MLTKNQMSQIREHLECAQNPLFFFDNDVDGLCSFLLLQRFLGRGKGVPIKSFPGLSVEYFRKVKELDADYIFILDKPVVDLEFFKEARQINIPIVWIDHHEIDKKEIPEFVNYYNPLYVENKKNFPVTYLCSKISKRKEDLWLAVIGCIADRFFPEFYFEIKKSYPELVIDSDDAFDIFYNSGIGKIAQIFSFALKDRVTNVINMLKFLMKVKTPYDVLEETQKNYIMHERFKEIEMRKNKLISNAVNSKSNLGNVLFFQYGGNLSISSDISNELSYKFPEKVIVVVYVSGIKANISARGKNVREKVLKAIEGIEGATGGGHSDAVGAQVLMKDLEEFRLKLLNSVDK